MATESKRPPLSDRVLEGLLNKKIKVFLQNGKALDGVLKEYDGETLIISPETVIHRKHITTFYANEGIRGKKPRRP